MTDPLLEKKLWLSECKFSKSAISLHFELSKHLSTRDRHQINVMSRSTPMQAVDARPFAHWGILRQNYFSNKVISRLACRNEMKQFKPSQKIHLKVNNLKIGAFWLLWDFFNSSKFSTSPELNFPQR